MADAALRALELSPLMSSFCTCCPDFVPATKSPWPPQQVTPCAYVGMRTVFDRGPSFSPRAAREASLWGVRRPDVTSGSILTILLYNRHICKAQVATSSCLFCATGLPGKRWWAHPRKTSSSIINVQASVLLQAEVRKLDLPGKTDQRGCGNRYADGQRQMHRNGKCCECFAFVGRTSAAQHTTLSASRCKTHQRTQGAQETAPTDEISTLRWQSAFRLAGHTTLKHP